MIDMQDEKRHLLQSLVLDSQTERMFSQLTLSWLVRGKKAIVVESIVNVYDGVGQHCVDLLVEMMHREGTLGPKPSLILVLTTEAVNALNDELGISEHLDRKAVTLMGVPIFLRTRALAHQTGFDRCAIHLIDLGRGKTAFDLKR